MAVYSFRYNCGHEGKIRIDHHKFSPSERFDMIDDASDQDCANCKKGIKVAKIGSIIHGTMKTEDLIPAFTGVLKEFDVEKIFTDLIKECENFRALEPEEQDELLYNDLWNAMIHLEPEGYYFGCTEGDGSDYGYWPLPPEEDCDGCENDCDDCNNCDN